MRAGDVGHPVLERGADGVLERFQAVIDRHHLGAEELHLFNVRHLTLHVDAPHVDPAFQAEERRGGRGGDAVLARAGLGDDPLFTHVFRKQGLADGVVDLVRAGVEQVFPLEVEVEPACGGDVFRVIHRGGPARVFAQVPVELPHRSRVSGEGAVRGLQLVQRGHEDLGHELPPVLSVKSIIRTHGAPLQ